LITQQRALETLERFHIDEEQLSEWESELGLEIPEDAFGNKVYSQLHINLFKNVKKHLALGRSLTDIKRMVVLPEASQAIAQSKQPLEAEDVMLKQERENAQTQHASIQKEFKNTLSNRLLRELRPVTPRVNPVYQDVPSSTNGEPVGNGEGTQLALPQQQVNRSLKRFASSPVRIASSGLLSQQGTNAGLLVLIDRLMEEKDDLQANLMQMEKQKDHLYQANEMFQRRVSDLNREIERLHEQLKATEHLKLIDDKSRLQKQVIDAEHRQMDAEKRLIKLNSKVKQLEDSLASKIDPKVYIGNWLEEAELSEVVFDNFGINIESKRNRMFRITQPPERFFGHTAIVETVYDYQTNTLWKRTETLILNIVDDNRLEGEMIAEYTLDGTPVARATYRVKCFRNGVRTD
jgi:DNA-binding transcriptional MerR regulator